MAAKNASTAASSVTSSCAADALFPSRRAASATLSALLEATTAWAPSPTTSSATAKPIPEPPPITRTRLFSRTMSPLLARSIGRAVDLLPQLALAADAGEQAATRLQRVGIHQVGGAGEGGVQVGHIDPALPGARLHLSEVAQHLQADQLVGAALLRVGLRLGRGPDDDAAGGRAAVLEFHVH